MNNINQKINEKKNKFANKLGYTDYDTMILSSQEVYGKLIIPTNNQYVLIEKGSLIMKHVQYFNDIQEAINRTYQEYKN